MYFVSKHSSFDEKDLIGTLIGIHNGYLYSGNSFKEKLNIYRKKIFDTGDWELIWNYKILNKNICICSKGVSVAYGIIKDELYLATYGRESNGRRNIFNFSSIHLNTNVITNYIADDSFSGLLQRWDFEQWNLCNACRLSHIVSNPADPSQIIIIPWYHKTSQEYMRVSGYAFCYQAYFFINKEKVCISFENQYRLAIKGKDIASNLGMIDKGKMIHFRDDEFVLPGNGPRSERKLKIAGNFKLKEYWNLQYSNNRDSMLII